MGIENTNQTLSNLPLRASNIKDGMRESIALSVQQPVDVCLAIDSKGAVVLPPSFNVDDLHVIFIDITTEPEPYTAVLRLSSHAQTVHKQFCIGIYHDEIDEADRLYRELMVSDTGIYFNHIARPNTNTVSLFITKPTQGE